MIRNKVRFNKRASERADRRTRPSIAVQYGDMGYQRSDGAFVVRVPYVNTRHNEVGHFDKEEKR